MVYVVCQVGIGLRRAKEASIDDIGNAQITPLDKYEIYDMR